MFNTQVLSKNRMNFPYPLFSAFIYDIIQFSLSASIMTLMATTSEKAVGPIKAYRQLGGDKFWKVILPCAAAAGLDIALSNCSLKHVSLSFYTMVKSSSPMFILIFAFVFGLEKLSWTLAGIVGLIGFGTLLTVWNPAAFNLFGFTLVFSAAVMSGVRWALTQLIIESQSEGGQTSKTADGPLAAILFLTPPIGLTLALLCQIFEGFPTVLTSDLFTSMDSLLKTAAICLTGGILTFSLILTEYKVVERSSVITLSISGIVKEILMIAVSVLYFKDQLSLINYVGLFTSISGIIFYNWYKISRSKKKGKTRLGPNIYLAVPTYDPVDMFINPFGDDDELFAGEDVEDDSGSFLELEDNYAGRPSARVRSSEDLGSTEAGKYFQCLKHHWSSLPSLEHYPVTADSCPGSEPTTQDNHRTYTRPS